LYSCIVLSSWPSQSRISYRDNEKVTELAATCGRDIDTEEDKERGYIQVQSYPRYAQL
jgi:hypothetical protein